MHLIIVAKDALSAEQARHLQDRLQSPDHAHDKGPCKFWDTYNRGLYAVVDRATGVSIGVVEFSGPLDCTTVGWWLDKKVRGQGLGNVMIDAIAMYLKGMGVSGIAPLRIDTFGGEYSAASAKLERRLRSYFQTQLG